MTTPRVQAIITDDGISEHFDQVLTLERARGDGVHKPKQNRGEARKPMHRLDGLGWLTKKGRLTTNQKIAGETYGNHYRLSMPGSIKSGIDFSVGGGGECEGKLKLNAIRHLAKAQTFALHAQPQLIFVCDQVCGEGKLVTEISTKQRDAIELEQTLLIALDLLSYHYRGS